MLKLFFGELGDPGHVPWLAREQVEQLKQRIRVYELGRAGGLVLMASAWAPLASARACLVLTAPVALARIVTVRLCYGRAMPRKHRYSPITVRTPAARRRRRG